MGVGHGAISIFSLNGHDFLLFYYTLIIGIRILLWVYEKKSHTKQLDFLNTNEDPFFIAWLKDPAMGIVKLTMAPLIDEGYIDYDKNQKYKTTEKKKSSTNNIEKCILNHFKNPGGLYEASKLFKHNNEEYRKRSENARLTFSTKDKKTIIRRHRIITLLIMSIGICKLIIAINNGHHNIVYLLLTIFIIVPFIFASRMKLGSPTLTPLGKQYLQRYHNALSTITDKNLQQQWLYNVLAGSAVLGALSPTSTSASGSGCSGSSCSGSSCSGSSCGGSGCGGCSGD